MDLLSTDMNSMINNMSSWWGSGNQQQPDSESDTPGSAIATGGQSSPTQAAVSTDTEPSPQEKGTDERPENDLKDEETKEDKEPSQPKEKPLDIDFDEVSAKAVTAAKEWGSYLFTFGKSATEQVTHQVSKTAQQFKSTIDEKTFIGDFNHLQDKFVTQQQDQKKKSEASVAPWVGYNEEEAMKSQILALSADKRNFLRNPPAGVQFNFDFAASYPVATAMLQEDPNLKKMRFDLVPKQVKEDMFWRNYFYRVSLIKQSAQLTSLAQQTGKTGESTARPSPSKSESSSKVSATKNSSKEGEKEAEEFTPGSPTENEFASDAFQENQINEEDIKKEMLQLGMSDKEGKQKREDIPDWEKELQAELQEYEVVDDGDDSDLEQEIMEQLEAESNGEGAKEQS